MSKKLKSIIENGLDIYADSIYDIFKDAHKRKLLLELCDDIVNVARENDTLNGFECVSKAAIKNDL